MSSTTLREMLVKQEHRSVNYCYVCSGPRAEYTVFSKPYADRPFFPFLDHHQPPEGAENMRPDGRVLTCLVCYNFLMQQWDAYEKNKTPHSKRIYWLKRLDSGPFAGMDLNLQQDYESLFESSSTSVDIECRSNKKQSRSHHPVSLDTVKSKLSERTESLYSNSFNIPASSNELNTAASNILDLSMPTRTPSQPPSTSSPVTSGEVCYICGIESKFIINVFAKPIPNCPYFPSLMMHPKPANAKPMDNSGKVSACDMCHKSLIQQWDSYQRQNVPHHERAYQCKSLTTSVKQEIRMKDKLFVCYTCGMITQLSAQRFINAYPEKEGDPFFSFLLNVNPHPGANKLVGGKASVCSLCYKTLFRQLRVYELSDTPEEKRKYKIVNESASDSSSMLRQHLKSSKNRNEEKFACYLCELISESLILVNTLPVGDIYFPFIRSLPQPSNASPMDSKGCVKICKQCHISLTYQWEAFERAFIPINQRQYKIPGSKLPNVEIKPVINSVQQSNSVDPSSSSSINTSDQDEYALKFVSSSNICSLCECPLNSENVCFIETVPQEKNMYFPSLRLLIKPNNRKNIDQYGRILGCNQCYLILKSQWEVFESAHVPHSQRQYEIFSSSLEREQGAQFTNNVCLSNASAALHIQVSSPDIKVDLSKHSSNVEPLLTTVNTLTVSSVTETSASMLTSDNSPNDIKTISGKLPCNSEETVPRICGPLDVPYVRPLFLMQINCFVCGEPNSSGLTYAIRSGPVVMSNIDKVSEEVPFFPFLTKHPLPEGAEKLSNDGNALVCMFCYHSLISQWLAYESSPYQEDANPWHRRYNTHNYVCYICGITTYRKRVCSISVKDFPFLLEHTRPSGALTLLNGECVVTCQTCFESIISQWKDFERMKVPVEMRKYNWIVLPPPPDDENSRGCQILSCQDSMGSNVSHLDNDLEHVDKSGTPHGLKPVPSHLSVPTPYGLPKPVGRNVVSPVHQSSSHTSAAFSPFGNGVNPALNATRTSSFAAALRKLAKQAVDPAAEKELSPISPVSSPASNQQSSQSRHPAALTLYANNQSSAALHGSPPPSVSITPLQNTNGKALDLGRYMVDSRNGNVLEPLSFKMESSKLINVCSDKRSDAPSGNKHLTAQPNALVNLRQEMKGFQPYRNSDERHPASSRMYNSPPPPSAVPGYSYHPSFGQPSQLQMQQYRLEESAYMERYRVLRPPSLSYQPPNPLTHPRASPYHAGYLPDLSPSLKPGLQNNSTYTSNRYVQEEGNHPENSSIRKHNADIYREQEMYLEREEQECREREMEYLRKEQTHTRQSPLSRPSSCRTDVSNEDKGHMGSITQGTPRDYVRRLSPLSSSAPLNLARNINHTESEVMPDEEYITSHSMLHENTDFNKQMFQRHNHVRMNYAKENEEKLPARLPYHINMEREQKQKPAVEKMDSSVSSSLPYYIESNYHKSNIIEMRTVSIGSVIDSEINGIYARDKSVSNNSYDYLSSFSSSSERNSAVDQNKSKSDFKIAFSAQDSFPIPSNLEKPANYQSSNFDSPNSKLPAFMLNNHSFPYKSDSSNHQQAFNFSEASLNRSLPAKGIPATPESGIHTVKEEDSAVVSTLDAREARIRQRRMAMDFTESEESEIDSEEEDALRFKRLLTISKGPPPKINTDPKKAKFLSNFGLVTQSKRQILEIKKCIRRHKILREKSISPVEETTVEELPVQYDAKHLSELAERLCYEEDFQPKKDFLRVLGLSYLSPEQKAENERIRKLIEDEKMRRNGCFKQNEFNSYLEKNSLKKKGFSTVDSLKHPKKTNCVQLEGSKSDEIVLDKAYVKKSTSYMNMYKSSETPLPRLSAFLKPPTRTVNVPVPPLIPTYQAVPSLPEPFKETNASIVAPKDPRVRQVDKDFVQEFHKSVLQTTQMQLAEKNQPSAVPRELPFHNKLSAPSHVGSEESESSVEENKLPFRWPGVEAIMESYECHIYEQTVEKKFLTDSCQKLKALVQESNVHIECLGRKTEELMQDKKQLEVEQRELQKSIDFLKLFIQKFR